MSVACNHISDFKLESNLLNCFEVKEPYTAANLAKELGSIATEWTISDKIVACVSRVGDSGSVQTSSSVGSAPASAPPPWQVVVPGCSLREAICHLLIQVSSLWSLPPGTCEEMAVVFQQTQRLFCSSFLWVRVAMSILACLEQVLGPRERLVGALFMAPHLITHYVSYLLALSVARLVPDQLEATQGDLMRLIHSHLFLASIVLGFRHPGIAGSELHEVEMTGPPANTAAVFSEPRCSASVEGQLKAENKCRSGRSKTQLGQEKKLRLPNIGNTCFLNSALQGLYGLPCFCSDITRQEALWSPQGGTTLKLLSSSREPDP
ncbi:hypothetical protein N1851_017355 [Merluccius polli]|uniref:Uncharacterized protein n=1 Tax=Merluccius polli TaxID=89951 RepID=A0AA47MPU7_MERPO|nr:hypothetical protein N1851_017355 [Merluccius polli]